MKKFSLSDWSTFVITVFTALFQFLSTAKTKDKTEPSEFHPM